MPKSVILAVPSAVEQHVLGLHVAVHDVVLVRGPERPRDLDRVGERLGDLQRPGAADQRLERFAVDVLEDDVRGWGVGGISILLGLLAGVDHGDDVRVAELRHRARLAAEALQLVGVRGDLAVHQLDRHRPFQHRVEGTVDRGHPALADLGIQAVAPAECGAEQRFSRHGSLYCARFGRRHRALQRRTSGRCVAQGRRAETPAPVDRSARSRRAPRTPTACAREALAQQRHTRGRR